MKKSGKNIGHINTNNILNNVNTHQKLRKIIAVIKKGTCQ